MNFLNFDLKKLILIIPLLSLPLITINMQQSPRDHEWYGKPFSYIAGQIQSAYYGFSQGVRSTTSLYLNLIDIKKENLSLKNENAELKTQLIAMTELKLENERLNKLFQFKQKTSMDLMAAKIIGRDISPDHSTILIDRGTDDGIQAGQAVITIEGVVGHIFRADAKTSRVMLITDRYSVVYGLLQRSRSLGLIEGKSTTTCSLRYMNKLVDVQVGDIVVTSGLDKIFPKGLPIAIVEKVSERFFGVTLEVEARPIVDPNKLEEVFIITAVNNEDFSPKEPSGESL